MVPKPPARALLFGPSRLAFLAHGGTLVRWGQVSGLCQAQISPLVEVFEWFYASNVTSVGLSQLPAGGRDIAPESVDVPPTLAFVGNPANYPERTVGSLKNAVQLVPSGS